jgi:hypothetical protein
MRVTWVLTVPWRADRRRREHVREVHVPGPLAVLPGQSPSDSNYYRYTDELAPTSAGQWQVVSDYPLIYYPRA